MRRHLPTSAALRAFQAAAREASFTRAALELAQTQGAISHQIRELEHRLGGPVFSQTSLAIDAAVSGQGIALARSALAALDLIAGRLIRPVPHAVSASYAYWIVCPPRLARLPRVARLRAWLLAQAEADRAFRSAVGEGRGPDP